MGPEVIYYSLAILLVLVLCGVHVGVALGIASAIGMWLLTGDVEIALSLLGLTTYEAIRSDALAVIPLFILMGEIISRSGAASDLFDICNRALRGLPGRAAAATVVGNSIFAAVTGVSIASAAAFSRIAYPEMRRLGYRRSYALGVIAGSACLGMLIPPSVLLIVWAILTEASVGALFIAGVGPGLLLTLGFVAYCVIAAAVRPALAPAVEVPSSDSAERRHSARAALVGGLGILGLIVFVLGGLWSGIFTPTEAAGFGVLGSILVGVVRRMGRHALMEAIVDSGRSTAPILFLLIAGAMYARLLALSGGISLIREALLTPNLSPVALVLIMTSVWLVLGALVDSISIILMTVPLFAPIAAAIGFDQIAFAVFGVLVIEAGLLTPPVGLLVFAVKAAVSDSTITLGEIFRGSTPYWIIILIVAFLIWTFPAVATWLPARVFS